ncbi:MAG: hypothetical protein JNK78_01080 [Planctomycetes bacterium]|nr:hypothetical protein [Planctomycetota bacterium]
MSDRGGWPAANRAHRNAAAAAVVVGIVVLPALVAGNGIAAPPTSIEVERIAAAVGGVGGGLSELGSLFHRAFCWPEPAAFPTEANAVAALVTKARFAQVLAVTCLSLSTYVAVMLARGRLQALLACLCFALSPVVAGQGHVLRPESLAAAFAWFALLLLQVQASPPVLRVRRRRLRRLDVFALAGCASGALGLAVATIASVGECLLVPGVVLVLATLQIGVRAVRILRERGLLRLPIRAINARLLPWTVATLLAPAAAWWLLVRVSHGSEATPSPSTVTLLPENVWLRAPLVLLFVVGCATGIVRTGLRFGRGGRIGADVVLLVQCGVFLAAAAGEPAGRDLTPAAPAMAVVTSEGLLALVFVVRRAMLRR